MSKQLEVLLSIMKNNSKNSTFKEEEEVLYQKYPSFAIIPGILWLVTTATCRSFYVHTCRPWWRFSARHMYTLLPSLDSCKTCPQTNAYLAHCWWHHGHKEREKETYGVTYQLSIVTVWSICPGKGKLKHMMGLFVISYSTGVCIQGLCTGGQGKG